LTGSGLLDPWGRAALRRNPTVTSADAVIDGIKLSNHRIQYRLDLDLNGYINSSEDSPQGVTIRASAIAWSRGSDGEDDFNDSSKRYPDDDRLSWSHGAAKKEKSHHHRGDTWCLDLNMIESAEQGMKNSDG
jgi:hypothetical protein